MPCPPADGERVRTSDAGTADPDARPGPVPTRAPLRTPVAVADPTGGRDRPARPLAPPPAGRAVPGPAARPLPVSVVPLPPAALPPLDGRLPAPPAPPFAGLPEPRWCALPAPGWQARRTRPARSAAPTGPVARGLPAPTGPGPDPQPSVAPPPDRRAGALPTSLALPARTRPTEATPLLPVRPGPSADGGTRLPAAPAAGDTTVLAPPGTEAADHPGRGDAVLDPPAAEPDAATGGTGPRPDAARRLARQAGRSLSFAVLGATLWILALTTLPRLAGWQPTVITGHSMEPSIGRGDVVIVRPAPRAAYVPGAVITFVDPNRPNRLITHRVVSIDTDGRLRTRGDNNRDADATPVDPTTVRGRAVLRVPYAGRPVVWVIDGRWVPLAATAAGLALAVHTALAPGGGRRRRGRRRSRS